MILKFNRIFVIDLKTLRLSSRCVSIDEVRVTMSGFLTGARVAKPINNMYVKVYFGHVTMINFDFFFKF